MNNEEIEVKLYVQDLKKIEAHLLELCATLIEARAHEYNLRYDLPDGSLRSSRRVLRLRRSADTRLTYKGSDEDRDGVMARTEIEFTVGDFDAARKFLELLGYVEVAVYEKFRTTYELDSAHVMLDELPYGHFVEIEGADAASIRALASRLGLDFDAAVRASYLMLFDRLCTEQHLVPGRLTFEALNHMLVSPDMLHVRPADV